MSRSPLFSEPLVGGLLGPEVMELDRKALETSSRLSLTYYRWPQFWASRGCLFEPESLSKRLREQGWKMVQRPTGGGVMLHGKDLCFSLHVGAEHPLFSIGVGDSYLYLNRLLARAILAALPSFEANFTLFSPEPLFQRERGGSFPRSRCCLFEPTGYDLLFGGKKIAGCAQRRKKTLLHQISLSFFPFEEEILKKLFLDQPQIATIAQQNYGSLVEAWQSGKKVSESSIDFQEECETIHRKIAEYFMEFFIDFF